MAKNSTKGIGKFFTTMKNEWHTPAEGKYVPYKEYFSIFAAVGGDYTLNYLKGFLSFGTGCYLVAYYYNIPLLTFSAISVFFVAATYFWNLLGMGVDANLGFLPKKIERKYNTVYLSLAALGLLMLIFDFSPVLPESIANLINTRLKGIDSFSIFKIFGAHLLCNGWSGFRNIIIRKKLLKKLGRYKLFSYANVVQCIIVVILICELPLYELPLTERVWKLYLLFQLYAIFNFTGYSHSIADNISPNPQERLFVRSFPVKISHFVQNIVNVLLPTMAGAMFIDGIKDIGMFRYLLPVFFIISTVVMFLGLGKIQERIPAPPIEKKEYLSFWHCVSGIFKNKYLWISNIAGLLDSLGNGMLNMKTILLIYTWRETGLFFSLAEILIKMAGNPGQFLAPWIRKRFQYKSMVIFKYIVLTIRNAVYILAILFLGKTPFLCGLAMFIVLFCGDALEAGVKIAEADTKVSVTDYQMYISGERLEAYQGIIGWFTTPITTLVSLIIPLMFYRVGFTSDWDVLYMSDIRIQCLIIGLGFDLAGYILMTIPYLFWWDYTDEKHAHVMETLKQRAEAGNEAVNAESKVQVPVSEEV
ncbi:MAG: MFS transporter [Clostridia bacterium]|nr:MFS transporter [Clostridia bacterium]